MALNPRSGRLAYEIKLFQTRPPWGVVCNFEKDDQCDMFLVTMRGPKGTPYEDGSFKLTITIPEKYPFEPPLVKWSNLYGSTQNATQRCLDSNNNP
ncbi:hypothetical protein MSG28_012360 [Choristoneura fumiferana]|uniref:Uncharacterized protein n=1 Tax=Choristoneura fumiferana TaxID=7141 RepID=A0ACC0KCS5_CHOFU|nr:hypothetical protein MSG28_012360 [Choristoneura fumiferana]